MHAGFIQSIDIFQAADEETCSRLAQACTPVVLAPGELLIQVGADDADLYLLESGRLQVVVSDKSGAERVIRTLGPGVSVGETALLTGAYRSASVQAECASTVYRITRSQFNRIAAAKPEFRATVEKVIQDKIHSANLTAALFDNRLFGELDAGILRDVRSEMQLVPLKKGDRLLAQDELSDSLYIIINGQVRVFQRVEKSHFNGKSRPTSTALYDGDKAMRPVVDLGRGQAVGEIGFLSGEPRNASVFAIRDTLVARLDTGSYYRLLQKYPQALTRFFSSRILAPLVKPPTKKHHTVALIGLNAKGAEYPLPIDALARRLCWHIENPWSGTNSTIPEKRTSYIDEKAVDRQLGEAGISGASTDSAAHLRLQHWFAEQEMHHECLVFGANYYCKAATAGVDDDAQDSKASNWISRISQLVEQVVFVVDANTDLSSLDLPADFKSEDHSLHLEPRSSLVLLQSEKCEMPINTVEWLDKFAVDSHHHIRWSESEETEWKDPVVGDFGRVARLLTGQGIGLVLSGGGARGFGHIGVIRAMHEAGVPIDIFGGTSAGAISASIVTAGHDDDQAYDLIVKYGKRKNMNDYTLPSTSLFKGKRFSSLLRFFVGDVNIEDLWKPFFCVSINLADASEIVHTRGPLWKYVRASASMPIMLPPVADNGKLLADGAMLNAMPVEIMRSFPGCGTVIGIDVSGGTGMRGEYVYGTELSGWRQLMSKLNPFAKPYRSPALSSTILAISAIGAVGRLPSQRAHADFYLRPPVYKYRMMDYDSREQIMQVAYQAGKEEIAKWLQEGLGSGTG